jgi:AcrR family transcriptional regulator
MPRTSQQNEQLRALARARIMDSALTLFGQHGYDATTIKMIAQHANVAQGLLYNYFPSKEALLAAIFQHSMHAVRESFTTADQVAPNERIAALIRAAFAQVREHERFWRLSYSARTQIPVLATLGVDLAAWTHEVQQTIARYCHDAGMPNPLIEAAILFALIDGVSQHYVLDPQHYPLEAIEQSLIARYYAA